MNDFSWVNDATLTSDVKIKTFFNTNPQYYFGDPNPKNHMDLENPDFHLDLPQLSFNPKKQHWTNLEEIIGNEKEFSDYYRYLIEQALKNGHNFNSFRHHFWIRSTIYSSTKEVGIGFPWYDSNSEFSRMYQWILAGEEGSTYYDTDQGWNLEGIIQNRKVYFLETDDEYLNDKSKAEIYANIGFEIDSLKSTILSNSNSLKGVIENLTKRLGQDVWTSYIYNEDLIFGTKDWKPRVTYNSSNILKKFVQKIRFKR